MNEISEALKIYLLAKAQEKNNKEEQITALKNAQTLSQLVALAEKEGEDVEKILKIFLSIKNSQL